MKRFAKKTLAILSAVAMAAGTFATVPADKIEAATNWENLETAELETEYDYSGTGKVTYELKLKSSGTLRQITEMSDGYLFFGICNEDGDRVTALLGEGKNNYTTDINLIGGKYYIEVYSTNGNGDAVGGSKDTAKGSFTWEFESADETFKEDQGNRNDAKSSAYRVNVGKSFNGQFAENDSVDYYKFEVEKTGLLNLKLTSKVKSMSVSVVNYEGTFSFEENDIEKGTKNLTVQVPKGDYYLICTKNEDGGNYRFETSFAVAPAKTKLTSLKYVKNSNIKVAWDKVDKVAGYEIQLSKDADFGSIAAAKKAGPKKVKCTFKGFTVSAFSFTTPVYYCRVRSFKKVDGEKVYSDWSNVKSVALE